MGPDWFTVVAQIINFLILVVLLKRFLFAPIVRAMDRREAEIASRLEGAARTSAEAEQERGRYEALNRELVEAREELRAKARAEAEELRKDLLEKARDEVNKSREQWRESLHGERESFLRSLRRHVCGQVCTVARRVVSELADSSLEERIAACLERRIGELGDEERGELSGHFREQGREIVVRSAFELGAEGRAALVRAVNSLTDAAALRFEVEPSLVCGVEILAGGRSLAWNLQEQLHDLEERLDEALGKDPGVRGGDLLRKADDHGN
jgi:F-type H+-transporting ATPase subunit b